eukprot:CAMPEP_0180834012 /NCGR_PEP_ID=MMETSP1038_2-20121128/77642_1 /TAXON_ID=632150 /ORGANISM="Azadinium spinosum, Strain 3D9" /LENGTH=122 /DNA_ID=CAMNT_0022877243 /DNA_START=818 /DNA_END=1186 /DNA_ORIENTATION=+
MVASDVGLAISDDDLSQLHPSQRCVDLWIVEKFLWGFSKVKPPEQRHMLGCRHKSFHHMDGAALAHSCRSSTEIRRSSSVEEPVANSHVGATCNQHDCANLGTRLADSYKTWRLQNRQHAEH